MTRNKAWGLNFILVTDLYNQPTHNFCVRDGCTNLVKSVTPAFFKLLGVFCSINHSLIKSVLSSSWIYASSHLQRCAKSYTHSPQNMHLHAFAYWGNAYFSNVCFCLFEAFLSVNLSKKNPTFWNLSLRNLCNSKKADHRRICRCDSYKPELVWFCCRFLQLPLALGHNLKRSHFHLTLSYFNKK